MCGINSLDDMWEDFIKNGQIGVNVVKWDAYFLILLVEEDVYYVIDTNGYHLQHDSLKGFILKFDMNT